MTDFFFVILLSWRVEGRKKNKKNKLKNCNMRENEKRRKTRVMGSAGME